MIPYGLTLLTPLRLFPKLLREISFAYLQNSFTCMWSNNRKDRKTVRPALDSRSCNPYGLPYASYALIGTGPRISKNSLARSRRAAREGGIAVLLREELRRRLLEDRGICPTEACDKCGQLLGAVRFTRRGESGEWCSKECRGIVERLTIRKGGRQHKSQKMAECANPSPGREGGWRQAEGAQR